MHALILALLLTGNGTGVVHTRGRGTPEMAMVFHLQQPPVLEHISTIHMPDSGTLNLLTFDVEKSGSGAGSMVVAVTRSLEVGHEVLCQVSVACNANVATHHHPAAGNCGSVLVFGDEHLKVEVLSSDCGTKPDGYFSAYFTVR